MNRVSVGLSLLVGLAWLGALGPSLLPAQLVPLEPDVDLLLNDANKTLVAVQPGGDYVVAADTDFVFGIAYRHVAPGDPPPDDGPSFLENEDLDLLRLDSLTATPQGFDLLWHPRYVEQRKFFWSHLNRQGILSGEPVRVGGAATDWIWHLGGEQLLAGWALPRTHGFAAQRLLPSGTPLGARLRLNSRPIDAPEVVVVPLVHGGFLAAWRGTAPGSSTAQVLRARRFSASGEALGRDFDVTSVPGSAGDSFVAAAAPGGGFAIAWMLDSALYLRVFDARGIPLGREARVGTGQDIYGPESLAFDPAGNLLLLWALNDPDLRLELFDARGRPLGPSVVVSSEPTDAAKPLRGSVAWVGDSWLVVWQSSLYPFDFNAGFARRFVQSTPAGPNPARERGGRPAAAAAPRRSGSCR